jgi:hypothetical protein
MRYDFLSNLFQVQETTFRKTGYKLLVTSTHKLVKTLTVIGRRCDILKTCTE